MVLNGLAIADEDLDSFMIFMASMMQTVWPLSMRSPSLAKGSASGEVAR